jgi:hypothetical protein
MDWAGLAGLPPKVLAGYSDVTAVLEAVASKRCAAPDTWTVWPGSWPERSSAAAIPP